MDIRTLSVSEMRKLSNSLLDALGEGKRFRISQDSDGIKWKVGEGMWTPGYGTNDNPPISDEELNRRANAAWDEWQKESGIKYCDPYGNNGD